MIKDRAAYARLCEREQWEVLRAMSIDDSIAVLEALLTSELMDIAVFHDDGRPMSLARSLGISARSIRSGLVTRGEVSPFTAFCRKDVVTLRPGRSFIEERIRICNPTATTRPYYFWDCTATPNTPGFRFIYPMTLGTDHGAEKFFNWPIHEGKDLSRGTKPIRMPRPSSPGIATRIFSALYDDGADRGVVSYANHHQVPGKKAWTWGQGGYGRMYQVDLTDNDGPYNEVQTGPLLTQAQVGRLDPSEAIEWNEWWYPIHALGGFTYANKDVAFEGHLTDSTTVYRKGRSVGCLPKRTDPQKGSCLSFHDPLSKFGESTARALDGYGNPPPISHRRS